MPNPKPLPDAKHPAQALAAVLALRQTADRLERQAVAAALQQGWSWSQIAEALGVSKQAAHRRLSDVQAAVPARSVRGGHPPSPHF